MRRRGAPDRCARSQPGVIVLERTHHRAGDAVTGRLRGGGPASVLLLRSEAHEDQSCQFVVARDTVTRPDGPFELALPESALPSATGRTCAVRYLVRAQDGCEAPDVELEVTAGARPEVDAGLLAVDRLLPCWSARHFHIELADAELHGGGRLCGRVHRHGAWPREAIVVRVRCLECWRVTMLLDGRPPHWDQQVLWQQEVRLRTDPDATWAPFSFDVPGELPPAVEATTLAWRYELLAERKVRHWFAESAALTPVLRYEGARRFANSM